MKATRGQTKKQRTARRAREAAAKYGPSRGEVALYRAPDGTVSLDVRLVRETLWLSLNQIADLFGRDKSVISRHLRNVFDTNELDRDSVVAFFATTAADGKTYQVEYFNLDAIISVGYRVNSKRGTQFRMWATRVLREHILKGCTVNERRLKELNQAVRLIADVARRRELTGDEAMALLRVVGEYSFALDLLDDYDHQYVILDIFSRYVVGWMVASREQGTLAKKLIEQSCEKQGIQSSQLSIHSDRGPSMTSKTVAFLLADLGITKSLSRPHVSNDNPYSQSQLKTMKYRPDFPERFGCAEDTRSFCQDFFRWYNAEHYHSGIGFLTPENAHYGRTEQIIKERQVVLNDAFAKHPERFKGKMPKPMALPEAVWINKPASENSDPLRH